MFAWASKPAYAKRGFDAAKFDRLTAGWKATNVAINDELRGQLDPLRGRSRELFKNNEYGAKFGRMVRNNVVGPEGFTLQSRIVGTNGKPDSMDCNAVEAAWWRWMRPGNCEVTGKHSFNDVARLSAVGLARDGEILLRKLKGRQFGEFGFQLQILDVQRIDTTHNLARTANSNAVVMGVELDEWQRPVAYHLRSVSAFNVAQRERIPASELIHKFISQEAEQARGVPWMHAAMIRMNDLNGYREAAVIAARVGACKAGFFVSPNGEPASYDDKDDAGNFVTDVQPGEFDTLPNGYDFKAYDPTYPHDQFDAFCKGTLRGIASAIGVSYNGLANDLEGVNFSSIRAGVLDERDEWMVIQNWFISNVLTPIFEEWLQIALLKGLITSPNGATLPASKIDKFREHQFQPRRWQWVDPKKDMEASIMAIDAGLDSPQRVAASQGRDIEDVLDDLVAYQNMKAAKGIVDKPAKPAKPNAADDENKKLQSQTLVTLERTAEALRSVSADRERPIVLHLKQDAANITLNPPEIHITNERENNPAPVVNVTVEPTPVTVHVEPTPVNVTVEPAQVTVELEANLPEQNITLEMPARKTETVIDRDGLGRIKSTTQIETDV